MKKRLLALVCMIACIFGLTACGSEKALTETEQQKLEIAKQIATQKFVPMFVEFMNDEAVGYFADYGTEELEYVFGTEYNLNVDGYAVMMAMSSFNLAADSVGQYQGIVDADAKIKGDQIIVEVDILGSEKNATAEIILANDMFFTLEGAALNPNETMSELMVKAGLNTLVGMGTVFVVLILISGIISCFKLISKVQSGSGTKPEAKKTEVSTGIDNAVAQIAAKEAVVDESNNLELVAVIAAAIAASQGAASTDGLVVRSIIRRR